MANVIYLEINHAAGTEQRAVKSYGNFAEAEGACPGCKADPFYIQGGGRIRISDDTYRANGRCRNCDDAVGYIFAKVETIFGLEEDENMLLRSRCRVY